MWLYRNNIVAIHAALVVCAFAWLWGGLRGPELVPVMPWLVALLAEVMLCFPERRGPDESTYQARSRVWKAMRKDPLVWIEVGFLFLLVVPFANNGLCPHCDAAAIAEGANPRPLVGFLPFCVNRLHHLSVFLWFLPTLTAVTAVKHSLTKAGKRHFCEIVVWNAAALAVLGFVQQVFAAPGPLWWDGGMRSAAYFFSTFGYPNAGGAFFTSCFALSVALWRRHDDDVCAEYREGKKRRTESKHQLFWRKHYMAIPSVLIFCAAIYTLSRAAIALVTVAAVVLAAHAAVCTLARLKRAQRVKACAAMAFALVAVAIGVSMLVPDSVRHEIGSVKNSNEALDRFTGKSEYHSRVALDLLWDHPLFGCGGWGYAHLSPSKMTAEELKIIGYSYSKGGANVHNDYLQFLAEHGFVGFGFLLAVAVTLLIPACRTWKSLYQSARFSTDKKHQLPKPQAVFALPGSAFAVLVAVLVVLIHAFADCPMRSPAVLSLIFCELAALDGFLPRIEKQKDVDSDKE